MIMNAKPKTTLHLHVAMSDLVDSDSISTFMDEIYAEDMVGRQET